MPNFSPVEGGSSNVKTIVTIVIIALIILGFGYYLFKISPNTQTATSGGHNASLDTSAAKQLSALPAFDPSIDHYQGNAKAKNVFIEYADFQCPACAAAYTILKQVTGQFPDTVFVYRYFPLVEIHQNSVEAAMAAEAAGRRASTGKCTTFCSKNKPTGNP